MNLSELANESRSTKAREETRSCTKADRVEHVRHTDAVREADDPVRLPNAPVRQADESVREPDGALITRARTRSKHAPSSLPSSDHSGSSVRQADRREGGRKGGVWDLVDRLAALGIAYPEPDQILKRPLGRGCELDLLHAIVDYWEAHRDENGWKVAALGARIREASPSVPPDQGNWPKPAPVERPRPSAATANEAIQQRCPTCGARPPHYPRAGGQAQCTTCSDVFGPFVLIRTAKT